MKTTEILNNENPNRCTKRIVALNPVKRLLAALIVALVAICAARSADAQTTSTTIPVEVYQKIADMTTQLLTAPLTTAQRQALHAKNFNQLPASQRALYLYAVAFEVGIMVASGGRTLSSAALAEYLKTASLTGVDVVVTPELLAHKAIVKTAMQELNALTYPQGASSTTLQQAMDSGAVNSFLSYDDPWM